jgi:transcriptional/translational regulatory protein YebC/TACO1
MYQKKGKIELNFNKDKIDNDGLMDLFIELDAEDFEVDMEAQSATVSFIISLLIKTNIIF